MNESQMIGVEMAETLSAGLAYNVEIFVSLMDSSWYAIKNMGVHFSVDIPPQETDSLLNLVPQVRYTQSVFLDDKEGWMRVAASFVASGGERYLTIGNFDGHDNTETLFVGGGVPPIGQPDYYKISAYFIDDVSVVPDSANGIQEETFGNASLFPNPVRDVLYIEGERLEQIRLFDISGREVLRCSPPRKEGLGEVDLSHLPQGVYLLEVWFSDGRKGVHKVIRSE